jgi:GAF domain-containing protein
MENPALNETMDIPQKYLEEWQATVDLIARLMKVPAALIMRITDPNIEVFVSSHTQGNPYEAGDKEHLWDSGLYCETVIKTQDRLMIPNALIDNNWKNNPDIKFNMISYLGYPIKFPNGQPFGTICVLDNKANTYSDDYVALLAKMRDLVQSHLGLMYMNSALKNENMLLIDYIAEIKTLRGLIPICAQCKKIRDDQGYWQRLERYLEDHTEAEFSHGLCPECVKTLYPELYK